MVCHLLKNPLKSLIFPLLFINATLIFNTRYMIMFLSEYFLTHVVKSLVYYLEAFSLFPWMDFSYFSSPISPPTSFAVFFISPSMYFSLFPLTFQGTSVAIMLLGRL